jgi:hypothetical protein
VIETQKKPETVVQPPPARRKARSTKRPPRNPALQPQPQHQKV